MLTDKGEKDHTSRTDSFAVLQISTTPIHIRRLNVLFLEHRVKIPNIKIRLVIFMGNNMISSTKLLALFNTKEINVNCCFIIIIIVVSVAKKMVKKNYSHL